MPNGGSKFGMLKNLQQAAVDESTKTEKQEGRITEKKNSAKKLKREGTDEPKHLSGEAPQGVELKHYSSYMPLPLFAQLQIYVAKRKATRGKAGEKVSLQSVIAEAVQQYLNQNDK